MRYAKPLNHSPIAAPTASRKGRGKRGCLLLLPLREEAGRRAAKTQDLRALALAALFIHCAKVAEGKKPFLDWVRDDYDEADLRAAFKAGALSSFVNDRLLARE
jgi:hypothetical protein